MKRFEVIFLGKMAAPLSEPRRARRRPFAPSPPASALTGAPRRGAPLIFRSDNYRRRQMFEVDSDFRSVSSGFRFALSAAT